MHSGSRRRKARRAFNLQRRRTLGQSNNGQWRGRAVERVVLLGYMCSGKSSVGESLARRLGWQFLDFDVEIERREGVGVARIIEERGESTFRAMESALTEEIANEPEIVIAPGGGWITQPELLEAIRTGTLSAWLHVPVNETVRRLREDPNDRPFKELDDPAPKISRMMEEREPLYRRADLMVPAGNRPIEAIAFELEMMVRFRSGRPS